jgi:hypothetical protein
MWQRQRPEEARRTGHEKREVAAVVVVAAVAKDALQRAEATQRIQ